MGRSAANWRTLARRVDQFAHSRKREPDLGPWTRTDLGCDSGCGRKRCRRLGRLTGEVMGFGTAGQQHAQAERVGR